MDLFGMHQGYHDQVYGMPYHHHHHGHLGMEIVGGAAAFAAFKAYEHRQRMNGHPMSHPGAKAALAALAGFEITKLFEDNRYRHLDQERTRLHTEQQMMMMYDQRYGGMGMGGMGMMGGGMGMMGGMDPYAQPMMGGPGMYGSGGGMYGGGMYGGPAMYADPYARPQMGYGMGGGYGGGYY